MTQRTSTVRATSASPPKNFAGPGAAVPRVDDVRVLLTGLDPLAAAVALALADAGVCLFDVNDRSRVLALDALDGPYPAQAEGLPRELAMRAMLRRRSPRCVPLTAPELFPSAAVGGAVAVHAWSVAGDLLADLREPPVPDVDGHLPTLTVLTDGACVVRWPVTDWAHRPCRSCVTGAARHARAFVREHPLVATAPALSERAQPFRRVTRTVVAGEIAGILLSLALGFDDAAELGEPPAGQCLAGPTLHHGLRRILLPPEPGCLCSLSFMGP